MFSSSKVLWLTAQLRYPYTRACSMGNKQELEATVLLDDYDLAVILEIWWDGSHDWRVTNIGHRLFRRDLG